MVAKIAITRTNIFNLIPYKIIATVKEGLVDCEIAYPMPVPTLIEKTSPGDNLYRMRSLSLGAS